MQLRVLSSCRGGARTGTIHAQKKRKKEQGTGSKLGPRAPINHRSSRPKQRPAWSVSTAAQSLMARARHRRFPTTYTCRCCIHYLSGHPAPHRFWKYRVLPGWSPVSTVRNPSSRAAIRYVVRVHRPPCRCFSTVQQEWHLNSGLVSILELWNVDGIQLCEAPTLEAPNSKNPFNCEGSTPCKEIYPRGRSRPNRLSFIARHWLFMENTSNDGELVR